MQKSSVKIKKKDILRDGDHAEKFLWWKYDNGSYASVSYDPKTQRSSNFDTYPDRHSVEWCIKQKREQGVPVHKVMFDVGIKKISKPQKKEYKIKDVDSLQEGFRELQCMLSCYAKNGSQHQILKLFSLILSGYVARMVMKEKEDQYLYFSRAPIVRISKHRNDPCGGFEHLQRIMLGLIVNTARDGLFDTINPASIPSTKRVTEINRCAYADLSESLNEMHLPTIYRDTAVLIHTGFFKDKEIQDFTERNKWCSVLLFNLKKYDDWKRLFAEVDLNDMMLSPWTWDHRKIHDLIDHYVLWLSDVKKDYIRKNRYLAYWVYTAQELIYRYNLACVSNKNKVLLGSEFELACLQMAAICSFFEYLKECDILSDESCELLFDEWANKLFPGSRSQDAFEKSQKRKQDQKRKDMDNMVSEFEALLKKILVFENGAKVCLLKKRTKYPAGPELDIDKHHWAFLATMDIAGRGKKIPIIKIKYDEIFKLAEKFNLMRGENNTQAELKSAIEDIGKPKYIHQMGNAYFNFEGVEESKKVQPAVTLILEEMKFLDSSIRKNLLERFSKAQ